MSGGGSNTIERESGPPAFQQPFIEDALRRARDQYNNYTPEFFPGTTTAGLPSATVQGTQNLAQFNNSPFNQNILSSANRNSAVLQGAATPQGNPLLASGLALQPQSTGFLSDVQSRATGQDFDLSRYAGGYADTFGRVPLERAGGFNDSVGPAGETLERLQNGRTRVQVNSSAPTAGEALGSTAGATADALQSQLTQTPGANPYVDDLVRRSLEANNESFARDVLPSLQNAAQIQGGYGGSRQAIAEANAVRDLNEINSRTASSIYSNQYNQDLSRNLQAAGLGAQVAGQAGQQQLARQAQEQGFGLSLAGLEQNDLSRQLQAAVSGGQLGLGTGQLDLSRVGLNNNSALAGAGLDLQAAGLGLQTGLGEYGLVTDAVSQGLQANQLSNNLLESGYRTGIDATIRDQAFLPQNQSLGLTGAQTSLQAGDIVRQYEQQLIDEAVNRYNFNQQQPIDALNRYANTVGLGNGLLGQNVRADGPSSGGATGAIGGAAAGAGVAAALNVTGPWGWAITGLGAALGYFG